MKKPTTSYDWLTKKWNIVIKANGCHMKLGAYDTEEEAKEAQIRVVERYFDRLKVGKKKK
jgi:hypothetical protein